MTGFRAGNGPPQELKERRTTRLLKRIVRLRSLNSYFRRGLPTGRMTIRSRSESIVSRSSDRIVINIF